MRRISFLKAGFSILILATTNFSIAAPVIHSSFKSFSITNADKVVISGIIKDESGNPVENATVTFDSAQVAATDKDGAYHFELGDITPTSHNIYFGGNGYATVVRTYYPIMGSTGFNIMLRRQFEKAATTATNEVVRPVIKDTVAAVVNKPTTPVVKKPTDIVKTESVPVAPKEPLRIIKKDSDAAITNTVKPHTASSSTLDLPSILFKPSLTALSAANKAFLDIVAQKLTDNPTVTVAIKANLPARNANITVAQKRIANIIKYLIDKNGIDSTRLVKQTITGGGDVDIIDIVNTVQ